MAPDYAEPTIGWRIWDVVGETGDVRLSSLMYRTVWEPGREMAATCRRSLAFLPWERLPLHQPPAVDCWCGIYATAHLAGARAFLTFPTTRPTGYRIVGRVALWGRVVEAEYGWRAAYGYPHELYIEPERRLSREGWRRRRLCPADVAEALADYDVPIHVGRASSGTLALQGGAR